MTFCVTGLSDKLADVIDTLEYDLYPSERGEGISAKASVQKLRASRNRQGNARWLQTACIEIIENKNIIPLQTDTVLESKIQYIHRTWVLVAGMHTLTIWVCALHYLVMDTQFNR